jgi:hypothetical protein
MMKKTKTAKEIVELLIKHRVQVRITDNKQYECACHEYFNSGSSFINSDKLTFEHFEQCNHNVCRDCLRKYISNIFEIAGVDFPFYCPGCVILGTESKSSLEKNKPYFTSVIPNYDSLIEKCESKDYERLIHKVESKYICMNEINHSEMAKDENGNYLETYKLYGFPENCIGIINYTPSDLDIIPGCNHTFCKNCLKAIFYDIVTEGKQKLCPFKGCDYFVSENFISKYFQYEENDDFSVLLKLKLSDYLYVKCVKCLQKCRFSKSNDNEQCKSKIPKRPEQSEKSEQSKQPEKSEQSEQFEQCDAMICTKCGDYSHADIDCNKRRNRERAKRPLVEQNEELENIGDEQEKENESSGEDQYQDVENQNDINGKKRNYYREYICTKNSLIPILRQSYFHALTLFHWEVNEMIYKKLYELEPTLPKFEFKVKNIVYILNEELGLRYIEAKKSISYKTGTNEKQIQEIYVFHGSKEENYDSICREGLKMGGRDVQKFFGSRHGLGIYTAKDPLTSTFYSRSNKLLVCKAFLGRRSNEGLGENDELEKFEHDYMMIENDSFQEGSTYYIFFRKEHLVPIYLIEFT